MLVTPLQSSAERDLIPGSRDPGIKNEDSVFPQAGTIVSWAKWVLDGESRRKEDVGAECWTAEANALCLRMPQGYILGKGNDKGCLA